MLNRLFHLQDIPLSAKKVAEPELAVRVEEVFSLIASIAMHTVRIDHEIEFLAGFLEGINQQKSILMMNIIITGSVRDLEHDRFNRHVRS